MPRFWYTCLKILMKHFKTLIRSVQILRCLLREFCLVVCFFFQWMSGTLQSSNMWLSLLYWHNQWLVHSAIAFEQVLSVSNIFSYKVSKIIRVDLNLLNVRIEPQVTVALVIAYCISLDASTACAVHILILLK